MPAALFGSDERGRDQQPRDGVRVHHGLDIRSVRYSSYAWASTPLTTRSSTPASRSHSAASRACAPRRPRCGPGRGRGTCRSDPRGPRPRSKRPGERAHHALDRDEVTERGLLQALLATERDGGVTIHRSISPPAPPRAAAGPRAYTARSTGCTFLEQEQALDEQRALVVEQKVPPLDTISSGMTTITRVSGLDVKRRTSSSIGRARSRNGASTMSSGIRIRSSCHGSWIRLASRGRARSTRRASREARASRRSSPRASSRRSRSTRTPALRSAAGSAGAELPRGGRRRRRRWGRRSHHVWAPAAGRPSGERAGTGRRGSGAATAAPSRVSPR